MNFAASISSLVIIIGCFLPWIQIGSLIVNRGINNPDGVIIFIIAIISGSFALNNYIQKKTKHNWLYLILGILILLIAYFDFKDVNSRTEGIINSQTGSQEFLSNSISQNNLIGMGLYIIGFGSFALIVCGLISLFRTSSKKLFYIFFFLILFLVFYFGLTILVPGFGRKTSPPVSFVKPFSFTNQDGKQVTEKDMAGKVYVAEYFFTNCEGICPKMNNNMRLVYEEFKSDSNFLILSHTCDPDRDSVGQMKYYADSMKVDTRRWIFLTGEKQKLYNAARVSYTIDDPVNNLKSIDDQFIHSQFWALVNKKGDVIKIYDGLKESEVKSLIKAAGKLLKEK